MSVVEVTQNHVLFHFRDFSIHLHGASFNANTVIKSFIKPTTIIEASPLELDPRNHVLHESSLSMASQ